MQTQEVIRFIQSSEYKGDSYNPNNKSSNDTLILHDLILIPPSAISENG